MKDLNERILLVPGFGLAGAELTPLAVRLHRRGCPVSIFWHWTGRRSLEESAARLHAMASRHTEETIHFVGHSLGGLVVLRMLADHPWQRPGRVVTMATPHSGIGAARRLAEVPGGRRFLWQGVLAAATGVPITIPGQREFGVLAGGRSRLLGRLIMRDEPSDSLIGIGETRHPACHAHITLPVTHWGMLLDRSVASHVDAYLRAGRFASGT